MGLRSPLLRLFSRVGAIVSASPLTVPLLGLLLLSLVGFLSGWSFVCDLATHFRVQYLVASGILLTLCLSQRQRWGWQLSLFCLVLNLSQVLPWYISLPTAQATDSVAMRIMISNIQAKNQNYQALANLIRAEQPDLLILLETTSAWLKAMDTVADVLPYGLNHRNVHRTDVAIYSRFPLKEVPLEISESTHNKALASVREDVLVAQFEREGVPGVAIAIHPPPPIYWNLFARRNRVLEEVSQYIQKLQEANAPGSDHIILGGDFNITMWSAFYQKLTGQTGLKNSRDGFGILPTWPAYAPLFFIPIDHCLISPSIPVQK